MRRLFKYPTYSKQHIYKKENTEEIIKSVWKYISSVLIQQTLSFKKHLV